MKRQKSLYSILKPQNVNDKVRALAREVRRERLHVDVVRFSDLDRSPRVLRAIDLALEHLLSRSRFASLCSGEVEATLAAAESSWRETPRGHTRQWRRLQGLVGALRELDAERLRIRQAFERLRPQSECCGMAEFTARPLGDDRSYDESRGD